MEDFENVITDDEEFLELVNIITARRKYRARIYRPRKNCFQLFTDDEFMARYRLSKNCVRQISVLISPEITSKTNWNHAVSAEDQLLITLRYYATGNILQALGDFHGLHKSTTGKIVHKVTRALAGLGQQNIKMPTADEERNVAKNDFYRISRFPSCIGALDCTHIKITSPGGAEAEIYRNRKDFFSLNCQAICNANLIICDVVCRWPGSSHDATIFNNSNIRSLFERGEFANDVVLGDSGYPIKNYLITPLRNPQTPAEHLFNEAQIRTRNPIERCFGVLKRRFPILALGIKLDVRSVEAVVIATIFLHNIAREMNLPEPPAADDALQAIASNEIANIPIGKGVVGDPNNHRRSRLITEYFERLL